VLPTTSAVGPAAKDPVSSGVRKGRDVEPIGGKVAQIVTKPIGAEVGARFFDKGLKAPVRVVEELQRKFGSPRTARPRVVCGLRPI
jgi:hypothetical protein